MRKIIQSINITADGFIDHNAVIADEELHENANKYFRNAGTLLFGRVTYQLFESYWPHVAKERKAPKAQVKFADLADKIDKIVFSRNLKNVTWQNTTLLREVDKNEILKLKQQPGKDILIFGSPSIAAKLAQLGLIDEYHFLVQPMICGGGKHLFESYQLPHVINLKLTSTKKFRSGVVVLKYIPKAV
jgi:dihydrofolate reductase